MSVMSVSARAARIAVGATLLGAGWGAQAQTAPPAAPSPRTALPTAIPPKRLPVKPLTAQENAALQALFTKLRPATLRIEQCPVNDCTEPDGIGTGFLISADGLALTAYHVVFQAPALSARTGLRRRVTSRPIASASARRASAMTVSSSVKPRVRFMCEAPPAPRPPLPPCRR